MSMIRRAGTLQEAFLEGRPLKNSQMTGCARCAVLQKKISVLWIEMRGKKHLALNDKELQELFEALVRKYHKREYVGSDPLIFLYEYQDPLDREIVGLVVSSLSYGRVEQIKRSCRRVLSFLGSSPRNFLLTASPARIASGLHTFRHRFSTGAEVAQLLSGVRRVLKKYGSLNNLFLKGWSPRHTTVFEASCAFVRALLDGRASSLLPDPERRSACKRLNMFLRWQIRCDQVDPGGWEGVPPRALIVPLDTHLFSLARLLGLTSRKTAGLKAALEVTERLRRLCPEDPVKYDFALTRPGIHEHIRGAALHRTLHGLVKGRREL